MLLMSHGKGSDGANADPYLFKHGDLAEFDEAMIKT
jgi:hypothetical protein